MSDTSKQTSRQPPATTPGRVPVRVGALVALALLAALPLAAQDPAGSDEPRALQAVPGPGHRGHEELVPERSEGRVYTLEELVPERSKGPVYTLGELEAMALETNPTLEQARAAVRAAQGRWLQSGLWPNPRLGYEGEEITRRSPGRHSAHFLVAEQTIPLGGKLGKGRRIFDHEIDIAETQVEVHRLRVVNGVRTLFYEGLAAQALVELRAGLTDLGAEAVEITAQLVNTGAADVPDLLEAEVEAERAELAHRMARHRLAQIHRHLAAMLGRPELSIAGLEGDLEGDLPKIEWDAALERLLAESPQLRTARQERERWRAVTERARAEAVPDLSLRGGVGYDLERVEGLRDEAVGLEFFIGALVEIPLFDRNQGTVASARAQADRAQDEVRRVELVLRSTLATAFREYRDAQEAVDRYRTAIVPRARRAHELQLDKFEQMAAAYPQVLIAQRTAFQVQADYLLALARLWRSAILIDGLQVAGGLDAPHIPGELDIEVPGLETLPDPFGGIGSE